jgi:hypothetical protein
MIQADESLQTGGEPLPFRLGVAPVRVVYEDPRDLFPATSHHQHGSLPDGEQLRRELIEALRAAGWFERVEPRGGVDDSEDQVDEQAWSANDDLVLELTVNSYHQEYLGTIGPGRFLSWFTMYTVWVWPAFWMPVELYGVGLEVEAKLRSVQDLEPLVDDVYTVEPGETATEHTPNDRELVGFLDASALWSVSASMDESNWKAVERNVGPHARRALVLELLRDVQEQVLGPLRAGPADQAEAVLRRVRKRFALSVGITLQEHTALGSAPHASLDAQGVSFLWSLPRGGALDAEHSSTLLVDGQATREQILAGIAAVASQASPADEVIVYFAGLGASERVEHGDSDAGSITPYLLCHDTVPGELSATGLSLAELGQALSAIRARRALLVCDASFTAQGRGYSGVGQAQTAPRAEDLLEALGLGGGWGVVFAAGPGQGARELPDAQAGLFTHVLRTGIGGAADEDRDARVSLVELLAYLQSEVPSRAGLEGFAQEPWAAFDAPPDSDPAGSSAAESARALGWPR